MEFNHDNKIVSLCLQGMAAEEQGENEKALDSFTQAWNEASNDFEKFLAAHYISRHQGNFTARLKWLELALQHAKCIDNNQVKIAFPGLYRKIGKCYETLNVR